MNKNIFNTIEVNRPRSNYFDLSHDVKLTLDMGELVPVMAMDCLPGDRVDLKASTLIRFSPLIAPVMHRMDVTVHYFFVPNRLLWDDWETFITGSNRETPTGPQPLPAHPTISLHNAVYAANRLMDYMGLPDPVAQTYDVNALPFSAYQFIYNEYYRDQNLQLEIPYKLNNGGNSGNTALIVLRNRAWEHDYFTSCLPFAQKGSAVSVPLGDIELKPDWATGVLPGRPYFQNNDGSATFGPGETPTQVTAGTGLELPGSGLPAAYDPAGTLQSSATTINDLRRAMRLQEWLEKNARAGTRYTESILAHFGVRSSDARLQRPEYITGMKSPVIVSEVLNTSETPTAPQGSMSGHAINVSGGRAGSYFCEEHGWIIGLMSVMPKTAYQQGIPRAFSRFDTFDYAFPEFANIGEQEVLLKEIYAPDPNGTVGVFGYVPRYSEYKYMPSRVAGDFKTSLDFWHLGRIFTSVPFLSAPFVISDPTKRVFAVTSPGVNNLYCQVLNQVRASRLLPKFGTPTF